MEKLTLKKIDLFVTPTSASRIHAYCDRLTGVERTVAINVMAMMQNLIVEAHKQGVLEIKS